jgi:hypothetical protein
MSWKLVWPGLEKIYCWINLAVGPEERTSYPKTFDRRGRIVDSAIFARLMANLCAPGFSELVLQVPIQFPTDDNLQHRLINAIAHGSQMAQICEATEAKGMIYLVTQHLFENASDCFAVQDDGARIVIGVVSHANAMARITPEVASKIYAEVRPLAQETLPTTQHQLALLRQRLDEAWREITNIVHSAQMDRTVRGL